ncbi:MULTISPECIES: cache domain-containing protein [unclassified Agarivorans]|uniref:cache domain-containing protein n=1 Tax=unclassified Agarivorans TaxID=2636026 RepID=UPI0026E1A5B2|nr:MULTISPECIES: cache domain-containing protein [unclassified Agarivorans]MDO6687832.1 cache domain-containing protein [Agarivorans sp. 3_MG-2023]MDO6717454.1 cache domain-containing protein [Agarivorans sp. 2_MG-2023]MDO6763178.1 cache domain-containing protein [Agarivorans sp. 1_MG-2023]
MWSLKFKIILLSIVPLVCVTALIATLVFKQSSILTDQQLALIKENIMRSKTLELQNHIDQAFASIRDIYEPAAADDEHAKHQVRELLNRLRFAEDGYFFAYTLKGVNLVHPIQPELVGQNLWDFEDSEGTHLIQDLIAQAKAGGGFSNYLWEKPSTGKRVQKLGYVVMLDKWQWMFGTGVYLDDVDVELAKLEMQTQENINRTFIWLFIITTISGILIAFLGASLNISEHKLADKKLKELTQRIIDSQEQERQRVSRELHDGINQLLVSIKYRLESATECNNTPASVAASLNQGLGTINEAIGEIRRISKDLRPSVLDDLGLAAALGGFCQEFEHRTGIDVFLECDIDNLNIPSTVETTFYRITQEALQNVEKHAQADTVDIVLNQHAKTLVMKIRDNGIGFEMGKRVRRHSIKELTRRPELASSGLGLRNIFERIAHIDGHVDVDSQLGEGTLITIKVPLLEVETAVKAIQEQTA